MLSEFRKHVDSRCTLIFSHNSKFFLFPTKSVTPLNSNMVAGADTVYSDAADDQQKVLVPGNVFSCPSIQQCCL